MSVAYSNRPDAVRFLFERRGHRDGSLSELTIYEDQFIHVEVVLLEVIVLPVLFQIVLKFTCSLAFLKRNSLFDEVFFFGVLFWL